MISDYNIVSQKTVISHVNCICKKCNSQLPVGTNLYSLYLSSTQKNYMCTKCSIIEPKYKVKKVKKDVNCK